MFVLPSLTCLTFRFSMARSLPASLLGGALLALVGLTAPAPAAAQDAAKSGAAPKAASAAGAPVKQASVATKAPTAKAAKTSSKKKEKVVEPQEEPEVAVVDADETQLLAAKEVHLGESGCEFDQKIQLDASSKHPGYVDMSFNKKKYTMKPVMSPTGALRLEDVRSETLMIQIPTKTMVMNQKTGQRLVDNCVHANQANVSADTTQVLMK